MRVDVRSTSRILKALQDVDYIIHLAAVVGVGQSFWQPRRYIDVNVKGTATIFECLIRNPQLRQKIKKIVVASSKSIYGEGSYRCRTHGVLNPPPRPVEQLSRKEWEVKCPQCGEVLEPVGIKEDKALAWSINVEGTKAIAKIAKQLASFLIYLSTDYVFDGQRGGYAEDDAPSPINCYGLTKLCGEIAVASLERSSSK